MGNIGNMAVAFLPIVSYSYLMLENRISEKFIYKTAIILIITSIFSFYNYKEFALGQINSSVAYEVSEITVNASTLFVMLMPMIMLIKKIKISIPLFFICLLFLIMGAKRGNIIAAIVPTILYMHYIFSITKKNISYKFFLLLVVSSMVIILGYKMFNDEYFMFRLSQTVEGDSSGRNEIYPLYINHFLNETNIFKLLFGNGYDSNEDLELGIMAHCDWLQILLDMGLLGFLLYMLVFILLLHGLFVIKNKTTRNILLSVIIIWGLKSIVSMAYLEQYLSLLAFPLAIVSYNIRCDGKKKNSLFY